MTEWQQQRFAISTQGMRELHIDRPPWMLVKELIQNAWDEAPEATVCRVRVKPEVRPGVTKVVVEDDGPGFSDIADSFTLMKPTPKRMDPTRRGRFNIGEKEVVSVALEAEIRTVGWTVVFPAAGGRGVRRNRRLRGTVVTALLPWDAGQAEELSEMLMRFRPTTCRLSVNGKEVPKREPVSTRQARLPTVLQSEPGGPLRPTRRVTSVDVLEPVADTGWLYELGIPIQAIDSAYDVDVAQKVPLPPNRDTVGRAYLQDIYAEALNASYTELRGDDFAAQWVRTALEDDRVTPEAVKTTVTARYGDKVAFWSSHTDSNMRAAEAGYEVLHPRSMSPAERDNLRERGQVKGTLTIFPRGGKENPRPAEDSELTDAHRAFADWTVELAAYASMDATVEFVFDEGARYRACCTASTATPEVTYNLSRLEPEFFEKRGPNQLSLVIHELGHAHARKAMEHGPKWGRSCTAVGAMIALGLAGEEVRGVRRPVQAESAICADRVQCGEGGELAPPGSGRRILMEPTGMTESDILGGLPG